MELIESRNEVDAILDYYFGDFGRRSLQALFLKLVYPCFLFLSSNAGEMQSATAALYSSLIFVPTTNSR